MRLWYTKGMHRLLKLVVILLVASVISACSNPLAARPKAGLQVMTNDVPSSIFLNDSYIEKTPFIEKELQAGEYTLKIAPDDPNLVPYETRVMLRSGLLTVVTWKPGVSPETSGGVIYEMEPLKTKGQAEVSFITIPDGAIISFDGGEKEFTPLTIPSVSAGHHEFEISLPSYETQKHTINVVDGYRMIVNIKLAKQVSVDTSSPPETSLPATQSASASISGTLQNEDKSKTITITSTNYFEGGKEVLKVRDAASIGGRELGVAPVGTSYPYLGETIANWYKIDFNGQEGWVNSQYSRLN